MPDQDHHQEKPARSRVYRPNIKILFTTWTGRILLVNTIVFIAMSAVSGSLLIPDQKTLIEFGAKDPALLVNGEYWRLIAPMFVHVGMIHFGLNSLALYYIGQQIEQLVGKTWFVMIYLICGLTGGIASAVFTVSVSAGASGAIFGLLGVGLVFERIVAAKLFKQTGEKLRRGPYTGLVIINLVIGFIISRGNMIGIDNAAHVGGLVGGCVMTLGMLKLVPNRLWTPNKPAAFAIFAALAIVSGVGAYLGTSRDFVKAQALRIAEKTDNPAQKFTYYTQIMQIDPDYWDAYYERGSLLIFNRQTEEALQDFSRVVKRPEYRQKLIDLASELQAEGLIAESNRLRNFLGAVQRD